MLRYLVKYTPFFLSSRTPKLQECLDLSEYGHDRESRPNNQSEQLVRSKHDGNLRPPAWCYAKLRARAMSTLAE